MTTDYPSVSSTPIERSDTLNIAPTVPSTPLERPNAPKRRAFPPRETSSPPSPTPLPQSTTGTSMQNLRPSKIHRRTADDLLKAYLASEEKRSTGGLRVAASQPLPVKHTHPTSHVSSSRIATSTARERRQRKATPPLSSSLALSPTPKGVAAPKLPGIQFLLPVTASSHSNATQGVFPGQVVPLSPITPSTRPANVGPGHPAFTFGVPTTITPPFTFQFAAPSGTYPAYSGPHLSGPSSAQQLVTPTSASAVVQPHAQPLVAGTSASVQQLPTPAADGVTPASRAKGTARPPRAPIAKTISIDLSWSPLARNPDARELELITFLKTMAGLCIVDVVFGHSANTRPHTTFKCPSAVIAQNSVYNKEYRPSFKFPSGLVCWKCAVPYNPPFNHDANSNGSSCIFEDMLKPLAYMIFKSPELRKATFDTLEKYAVWLSEKDEDCTTLVKLFEVVWTYATMRNEGTLPLNPTAPFVPLIIQV